MEFEGKRVLILDDSIVRGNTSRQIVKIARQMGAKKVYLASYSPALLYPCPYGVDMSTKREFVARGKDHDALCADIGCDYLLYQGRREHGPGRAGHGARSSIVLQRVLHGRIPTGDITEEMLSDIECDRLAAR